MIIELHEKYDLLETLYSGQAFRWSPLRSDLNISGNWHEAIVGAKRIRLKQENDTISIACSESSSEDLKFIKKYLRIEDDLTHIYSSLGFDKYLKKAVTKFAGLHLLRQEPWECLISFICSANNNIPRIRSIVDRLCGALGSEQKDFIGSYFCFPTAYQINRAGEEVLRKLGLGFRAKYVAAAAQIELEGELELSKLQAKDYETTLEQLIKIPGVGDKVANCVMLFSLDQLAAFPVDVWVRRVLRENYANALKDIPDTKLRLWSQQHFGQYAGYANQYLFHNRRLSK